MIFDIFGEKNVRKNVKRQFFGHINKKNYYFMGNYSKIENVEKSAE